MTQAFSPFDPSKPARILKRLATKDIVNGYRKIYEIDVTRHFTRHPEILLCECPITQLRFYFPLHLDGDEQFYQDLSGKEWYYDQQRWEHREVVKLVNEGESLLEIGSGDGAFLRHLKDEKNVTVLGLEFNPKAVERAMEKNTPVKQQTLAQHLETGKGIYDVVCSFQVMEHVSDIYQVLTDSMKALKAGGRLIIAVPNNDADFLRDNPHPSRFLNMPPHHVNLFDEASLKALPQVLPLRLKQIIKEPLQETHLDLYLYKKLSGLLFGSRFLTNLAWKSRLPLLFKPIVRRNKQKLTGHTIVAVFEKR